MASRKLPRLSKSLLEKPQLITLSKFQEISEVLDNRSYLNHDAKMFLDMETEASTTEMEDKPYGVLRVEGPTTYKPTGWEALCGGCSYVDLITQMESFAEQGKKDVVMWIDSPGGQAFRMMSTARKLRKIADDNDMRLIGYVDGMACSAGMGLASACHELVANGESEVGSIGVVISLMNNSKQLEKEGLERKFITAGDSKVPFEDDGSFREGFISDLQESVNDLYTKFVSHVATLRGIDEEVVKDTQARVFKAEKGLQLGLIDKIMEEDEFFEYLEATAIKPTTTAPTVQSEGVNVNQHKKGGQMSTTNGEGKAELSVPTVDAELATQLAEMKATLDAQKAQLEAYQAKELNATKIAMSEQLSKFSFASDQQETLLAFMMASDVSEESKQLMNSVLENAQLSITEITETAASDIAAAELATKEAKEEVIKVKEDFGKQESLQGEVDKTELTHSAKDGSDRTAQLRAKVQAKLNSK